MGRQGYSAQYRREVLNLLKQCRAVAHDLDLSDQTIYNWRRQDRIDRGLTPGLSTAENSELPWAKNAGSFLQQPNSPTAHCEFGLELADACGVCRRCCATRGGPAR